MQEDMHYYGTYAMARAAGIKKEICETIATAAQFVDDNAKRESILYVDGGSLDLAATAHHTTDIDNIDVADQRQIWVPFHFLPGNKGETFEEKLICRENSDIVKEMLEYVISSCNEKYGVALIGIAAHVYADTFSHQGFSGISSDYNRVNKLENITNRNNQSPQPQRRKSNNREQGNFTPTQEFEKDRAVADIAETLSNGLGHGAVNDYPDRPYLRWSYQYEPVRGNNREVMPEIQNPERFMRGCQALHDMFCKVAEKTPDITDCDKRLFGDIEHIVEAILKKEGGCKERSKEWQNKIADIMKTEADETIPVYDANKWLNELKKGRNKTEAHNYLNTDAYHFFQAASVYRNYVLRELLPKHGLMVA